jgi:hypothetical protein
VPTQLKHTGFVFLRGRKRPPPPLLVVIARRYGLEKRRGLSNLSAVDLNNRRTTTGQTTGDNRQGATVRP